MREIEAERERRREKERVSLELRGRIAAEKQLTEVFSPNLQSLSFLPHLPSVMITLSLTTAPYAPHPEVFVPEKRSE